MSILAKCACGKEYHLKDEYAGRSAKCACGLVFNVPLAQVVGALAAPEMIAPLVTQATHSPIIPPGVETVGRLMGIFGDVADESSPMSPPPMSEGPPGSATTLAPPDAAISPAPGRWPMLQRLTIWLMLAGGLVGVLLVWAVVYWSFFGHRNSSHPQQAAPYVPKYKGPKIPLVIKFTPGSYKLTETMNMDIGVRAGGQQQDNRNSMVVGGDVQISNPDADGEQKVRFTCRKIRDNTVAGGKTMSFDSDSPDTGGGSEEDRIMASMLGPMVGWQAVLTTKDRQFVRVEGVQDLMQRIQMAAPPQARPMLSKMDKMMQDFMQELLTAHWGELIPAQPVGPGDKWQARINLKSVPMLGEMSLDCDCMLKDIDQTPEGNVAILAFTLTTTIQDHRVDPEQMGMGSGIGARIARLDLTESGEARFDTKIGLSTKVDMNATARGTMSISVQGTTVNADVDLSIGYQNTLVKEGGAPATQSMGDPAEPAIDWAQVEPPGGQVISPIGGDPMRDGTRIQEIADFGPGDGEVGVGTGGGPAKATAIAGGGATLAPFGAPGSDSAPVLRCDFAGSSGTGRRIAYVCDASGSMLAHMDDVRLELRKSFLRLKPVQSFDIIFTRAESAFALDKEDLLTATPENKTKARDFIDKVVAQGETEPIPALEIALKCKPDLLFLLTDGDFPDNDAVVAWIKAHNADKRCHMNTLSIDGGGEKVLRQIAEENGGTYRLVKDLGDN